MRLRPNSPTVDETPFRATQVRKIGTTRRSVSGYLAFRGDQAIPFESTLERDFLIREEFNLGVLEVVAQPCCIPFLHPNGRSYTYTPDYLVIPKIHPTDWFFGEKPQLVEIKPEAEWRAHWREWLPKWKAASRYAKGQGWVFRIRDESRIRDKVLENIRFLSRFKNVEFPAEDQAAVMATVRAMGGAPVHYLLARHFMGIYRSEGIALIWGLLAKRRLECDIARPLNEFTELWDPNSE